MTVLWGKPAVRPAAILVALTLASPALAAATWPGSRVPYFGTGGTPMVGAQLSFYDCGTTTPQIVYEDGELSTPLDQPVEADARGMFPVVYLSADPGCYRQKLLDADDTLVFDDDLIDVPQSADFEPPDVGDTSEELLFRTGMMEPYFGTSAPSGWVRCNGRSIGSVSSGAGERANNDTEDLFIHLWTVDSTLAVSGGRGGTAAGDFAAHKTIALPDCRDRSLSALATMGNSDAGLVADAYVDGGEDSSDLGATAGVDDVALSEAQLAAHDHNATFTGTPLGNHSHTYTVGSADGSGGNMAADGTIADANPSTAGASAGTPAGSVDVQDAGSGSAHNNMAPTLFVTILIKL